MEVTITLTPDEDAAASTIPLLQGETREQAIVRMIHAQALRPIVDRYQREQRETAAQRFLETWDQLTPENKVALDAFTRDTIAAQAVTSVSLTP